MKNNILDSLYTEDGWLNIEGIAKIPSVWLVVIVGARQVGKTYGILKHVLQDPKKHTLYMRRTIDELDMISSFRDLNPFIPLEEEGITADILKISKKVYHFGLAKPWKEGSEDKREIIEERGLGLALSTIAQMRGFNGSLFTDLFFDEFIPEKTVVKKSGEGDALLNAYITVNGNRELKGKPPLKMWLAANAFDVSSPILSALGLTNTITEMQRNGEEWKLIEGGVFVCTPMSEKIIKRRTNTAMLSYIENSGSSSEFFSVAVNNSFAYDSLDLVRPKPIAGYKPFAAFGNVYIWTNGSSFYACRSKHNKRNTYGSSGDEKLRAVRDWYRMVDVYKSGKITFSDVEMLLAFRKYFGIKVDN